MKLLPWTDIHYCQLDYLSENLPSTLLLLDIQRGNANDMAKAIIEKSLCLSNSSPRPCKVCKSCHLISQNMHPDVVICLTIEKIKGIREITELVCKMPTIGKRRIVYLANIDCYNDFTLNALLKTLEEPQQHSYFILSATNRRSVKSTILSRSYVINLPKPSYNQAKEWLISQGLSSTQADTSLTLYSGNPYKAINNPNALDTLAFIGEFIAYLGNPSKNTNFFSRIDNFADEDLIDILQNQLQAIIQFRQLGSLSQNWHDRLQSFEMVLNTLDINYLHTLYAQLSTLRYTERQQTKKSLNIKSFLLDIFNKGNLKL